MIASTENACKAHAENKLAAVVVTDGTGEELIKKQLPSKKQIVSKLPFFFSIQNRSAMCPKLTSLNTFLKRV